MASVARRVDEHVGERIRSRRTELGLTQEDLASALEISYQQVQKYETGANRVSAGRLYQISRKLDVPVSFFYEAVDEAIAKGAGEPLVHGGANRSIIEIARNFGEIKDPAIRSAINGLIKSLIHKVDD